MLLTFAEALIAFCLSVTGKMWAAGGGVCDRHFIRVGPSLH